MNKRAKYLRIDMESKEVEELRTILENEKITLEKFKVIVKE